MFDTWDYRYVGGRFNIETHRCPNGLSVAGSYQDSPTIRTLYVGYPYREAIRQHREHLRNRYGKRTP